ncbi:histidine phosphotransferase ChpT [soil metagenome]
MTQPLSLDPAAVEPDLAEPAEVPAPAPVIGAPELAAALAARLCHDFISPASAIVSGVDLLEDPSAQDMRDDALNLIGQSARKLTALLAFSRVAFGASAAAETFDVRDLHKLADGVFAHVRASLEWDITPASLQKAPARALLNMAQLGATALPTGGVARVTATEGEGAVLLALEAVGPRARLRPEVLAGLRGEPQGEGLTGHWVQAYYLHALVTAAGGRIEAQVVEEKVTLRARIPA